MTGSSGDISETEICGFLEFLYYNGASGFYVIKS